MPDFEIFVARHGEAGVQAILEGIERREGVRRSVALSLKDRWLALLGDGAVVAANGNSRDEVG